MNTADVEYEDDSLNSEAMQYFFFKAGGDIYAIKANSVSEMVEYQPLTKVPMMQSFVKGVTNIRGEIVTVIDLLERFGIGTAKISKKTSLVIVNKIALIIDEVHEVSTIADIDIKASLDFGFKIKQKYIKNMARYNDDYIAILNCQEILNLGEISKIEERS
jgi:purine-binding chemotaxis protein CheW